MKADGASAFWRLFSSVPVAVAFRLIVKLFDKIRFTITTRMRRLTRRVTKPRETLNTRKTGSGSFRVFRGCKSFLVQPLDHFFGFPISHALSIASAESPEQPRVDQEFAER